MASTRLLTPGPGQYNSNLNDKTKSPSYRIGSAKRDVANKNDFPGPATYNALNMSTSNRPKSPTWSMGKSLRGSQSCTSFVPGPGNYDTRGNLGEGPKVINILFIIVDSIFKHNNNSWIFYLISI